MKNEHNVQTSLSASEYELLTAYAKKRNLTIKNVLKRAILTLIDTDTIDANDPFFNLTVKSNKTSEKHPVSENVDEIIYNKP